MSINSIKDMVKDGKLVTFSHYKLGELWYRTECGFEFPVKISEQDTGDATFLAQDKAMLFMRFIRKHIAFLEQAKVEHQFMSADAKAFSKILNELTPSQKL
jgi:hypothetical protein